MTTMRSFLTSTMTAAVLLAAAPSAAAAHLGEGPAGLLHDLLHRFALGPGHGLRPLGLLLMLLGAAGLVGAARAARSPLARPLRTGATGGAAILVGVALALI